MVVVVKYGVVYMPEEALIDYDKHFLKYLQLTRTTTTIYILFFSQAIYTKTDFEVLVLVLFVPG